MSFVPPNFPSMKRDLAKMFPDESAVYSLTLSLLAAGRSRWSPGFRKTPLQKTTKMRIMMSTGKFVCRDETHSYIL